MHIQNGSLKSEYVEETQVSIDRWKGKENVVYTYHGMLLCFQKEGNPGFCYNMDEHWEHHAKGNKPVTQRQRM